MSAFSRRRPHRRFPEQRHSGRTSRLRRARLLGVAGLTIGLLAATVASFAAQKDETPESVPPATDLVRNGGFAEGTAGWVVKAPGTVSVVAPGHLDSTALRLGTTRQATIVLNDAVNTVAGTKSGVTYQVSAWVRAATPNVTTQLRVREVQAGELADQGGAQLWLQDTTWHRIAFDYVARTTGATLDLNLVVWQLRADHTIDVDDVSLSTTPGAPVVEPTTATTTAPARPTVPAQSPTASVKPTVTATMSPTGTTRPTVSSTKPAAGDCSLSAKLVPSCGVLWGTYTKPLAGESWDKAYANLEAKVGRKFDIVKRYHDWSNQGSNGQFPDAAERSLGAAGNRILYFAWVSNIYSTGGHVMWKDIAAGKYDQSVILPQAQRFKDWGKPVFMGFDHEMDGAMRVKDGNAADFVAAYRHIHDVLQGAGVTNVVYVYNPTGYLGNEAKIKAMYPGDAYVDWIAWDPYNNYECNGTAWKTPETTFASFYAWLGKQGHTNKPWMLGEYGTAANPADPKAMGEWYGQVGDALGKLPNIKAAIMWDSQISNCDYRLSVSSGNIAGFKESGLSEPVEIQ